MMKAIKEKRKENGTNVENAIDESFYYCSMTSTFGSFTCVNEFDNIQNYYLPYRLFAKNNKLLN